MKLKTKIATIIRAGLDSGRMIRQKTPQLEQPSIRAASSRSVGMLKKNWRSRKVKNGPPKKFGTIRGRNVSTQPSCL